MIEVIEFQRDSETLINLIFHDPTKSLITQNTLKNEGASLIVSGEGPDSTRNVAAAALFPNWQTLHLHDHLSLWLLLVCLQVHRSQNKPCE